MSAKKIADIAGIHRALNEVFDPLTSGLKPHIVFRDGEKIDVLPFPLFVYETYTKKEFVSFNDALDEFFSAAPVEEKAGEKKIEAAQKKDEKPGLYEYRLQKQQQALQKFRDDEKKLVHKGELIYAHFQTIDSILKAMKSARDKGYSWDEIKTILKKSDLAEARLIRSIDPGKSTISVSIDNEEVELDIRLTVAQNSQVYYDRSKKLSGKIKGAIAAMEKTKELSEKEAPQTMRKIVKPKQKWYEQFRWFISSDGFLVIGGRDAKSNEDIVGKYLQKRDIFFHAAVSGSPAVVIKTEGKVVPETTLLEAAQFTVSYSGIWKSGQAGGDAYWVLPEQVSKMPEPGEYVAKGAFVIRGKRNYFKDILLGAALGLIMNEEITLIGGPLSAVKKHAQLVLEIEQGEFNQNDLSKKIYRLLYEKFEDKKLIKMIASPDRIAMFLPPGGSRLKES